MTNHIILLIIGIGIFLYPTLSDYYNSLHQTKVVEGYISQVKNINKSEKNSILNSASEYNSKLPKNITPDLNLNKIQKKEYNSILNIDKAGLMAFIEIPKLSKKMPIYHGTEASVLEVAIGHIPGTSFPIGGKGTHAVISGHRGLPSAKLFTDIDQLNKGDVFLIHVMDKKLTYEVDQILITAPDDISPLKIDKNSDLVTLVTCTPYGVNSHRLLVRGHRIPNKKISMTIMSDADTLESIKTVSLISIFIYIIIILRAPLITTN